MLFWGYEGWGRLLQVHLIAPIVCYIAAWRKVPTDVLQIKLPFDDLPLYPGVPTILDLLDHLLRDRV